MDQVINNLDKAGLFSMWRTVFPNWPKDYYDDMTEDEILDDMRYILINEIRKRERQREADEYWQSLMNMEP